MTSKPQRSTAAIALDASRVSHEGAWVAITLPKCLRREALRERLDATGGRFWLGLKLISFDPP
jgi:hypothetical protein